jgi:hypothetical protein
MAEKISRSTWEAYWGILVAIVALVFPMTGWMKLALVAAVGIIAVDVAFRHPKTINTHWTKRTLFAALGIAVIADFLPAHSHLPTLGLDFGISGLNLQLGRCVVGLVSFVTKFRR